MRKIAIDVDDVLANFHTALIDWHNENYGTSLKISDIISYHFHKVWGGTTEETLQKISLFSNSIFFKTLQPLFGAVNAVNILSRENELYVVTSRSSLLEEKTRIWLDEFFKDRFLGIFHSSNHYSKAKNSGKTKLDLCKELGASVLIDDSLDYVLQCDSTRVKGILFGDYPWNQEGEISNKLRARNWKEVLEKLT